MNLTGKEFLGIIKKIYTGDKYGWIEVEIPELFPDGETIIVSDGTQKHVIDNNSGNYFPLLEGQKVVIKFRTNNINSGYVDRRYEGNVFELGRRGAIGKETYIICQTPKNHLIKIDDKNNSIEINFNGGKSGIKLSDSGIELCSKGKIKISSDDLIDIQSSKQVSIHQGAANCSSTGATTNKNLSQILSAINFSPSGEILSQFFTNLIQIADKILSYYNDQISEILSDTAQLDKQIKETINVINDELNSGLINYSQILNDNYSNLVEVTNNKINEIDNSVSDNVAKLKGLIEQLDNEISKLDSDTLEIFNSTAAPEFVKFSKYFYYVVTGNNDFNLSTDDLNYLDEKYGTDLSYFKKSNLDQIKNYYDLTTSYTSNVLNDLNSNLVPSVSNNYSFLTKTLSEELPAALENHSQKISQFLSKIPEYLKQINYLSEYEIVTCNDEKRLNYYSGIIKDLTDNFENDFNNTVKSIPEFLNNLGNKIISQNKNSVAGNFIIKVIYPNIKNTVDEIQNTITNIKNNLEQSLNTTDLDTKKNLISSSVSELKNTFGDLNDNGTDKFDLKTGHISYSASADFDNVLCDILGLLANFKIDFNFGLNISLPQFLLDLIPNINVPSVGTYSSPLPQFSTTACLNFNPCNHISFSFDLNYVIGIPDLLKILETAALLIVASILMKISEILKEIKVLLSQKLSLLLSIGFGLSGAILNDLYQKLKNLEVGGCLTFNTKNLSKLVSSRISGIQISS